jgi:hypothetical protein
MTWRRWTDIGIVDVDDNGHEIVELRDGLRKVWVWGGDCYKEAWIPYQPSPYSDLPVNYSPGDKL